MEATEAYDFALAETITRLKQITPYYAHDPLCQCYNPENCLNRVKCLEPTEYCIQPMRDYQQAYAENFRKLLKQKMKYPQKKTSTSLTWCFITINPKPNIELTLFIKKLNQFIKTKIFEEYSLVKRASVFEIVPTKKALRILSFDFLYDSESKET